MSKLFFFYFFLLFNALWAFSYKSVTLKEGVGEPVKSGQLIQVHFKGWLSDSTLFDDSYERNEPLEFLLGAGQVIQGWDKGIVGMKLGEIRSLSIPYQLAYGDRSMGPIPPQSDLFFEVELVNAEQILSPDEFLTKEVSWKLLSPGVWVYDETVGSGPLSEVGKRLRLHHTGWLVGGSKFNSSKDQGKPMEVILGSGKLIKGLEIGLNKVPSGSIRWLKVAPSMAYGSTPLSRIPPNSTLLFKVHLLSVESDEMIAESMDFFPDTSSLQFQKGAEGLRYSILKEGEGEPAKVGESVRVHYTGWLLDGTKFDSSKDRAQVFEFPLGASKVIRGWDLGVEGMLPGEKRVLLLSPGLAYGSSGAGPIPPDANLIFTIEYLGN
ncbi:MAG: peptidylprolyl isomerase [Fibrobacter sp.]|jgi:peptidylprolyl isomerase|nr:peptidylprolyl isomerase [Fibrobacter sp.]